MSSAQAPSATTIRLDELEETALEAIKREKMLATKSQAIRYGITNILDREKEIVQLKIRISELSRKLQGSSDAIQNYLAAFEDLKLITQKP